MCNCKECGHVSSDVDEYIEHLEKIHFFKSGSHYACPENGCLRSFLDKYKLKKHVKSAHSSKIVEKSQVFKKEDELIIRMKKTFYTKKVMIQDKIDETVELFVASVIDNNVSRSSVQNMIVSAKKFNENLFGYFKDLFLNMFEQNVENSKEFVDDMFGIFSNSLEPVDSEHKRIDYFTQNQYYVSPRSYNIDTAEMGHMENDAYIIETKNVTGQYVPLAPTLKMIFNQTDIFSEVTAFMDNLKKTKNQSSDVQHFIQADLFAPYLEEFPKKITIPIKVYFDDLETNSTLGSHAGVHKVGNIYFKLLCLPPDLASKLENIFLSTIVNSNDRKDFGNPKALKPLIDELKILDKQ
ncbi:hypothetical protein TKK_0004684 [Trichogramma kaykai]